MDDLFKEEVKKDIKEIRHTLISIDKTLAVNTQSLEHHVKRTDLLERIILVFLSAIVVGIISGFVKLIFF